MKQKLLHLIVFSLFVQLNFVWGQSDTEKRNAISIAPVSLLNKTISIKYSHTINEHIDYVLNPMIRIQNNIYFDNVIADMFAVKDPSWYYDKYSIRTGVTFHTNLFFAEPLFQYEYGCFKNQELKVEDHEGELYDHSIKLDRKYQSLGLIGLFGFIHRTNRMSFKYYLGVGYHYKIYNEKIYEDIYYYSTNLRNPPTEDNYSRGKVSLHAGIEIGFRF